MWAYLSHLDKSWFVLRYLGQLWLVLGDLTTPSQVPSPQITKKNDYSIQSSLLLVLLSCLITGKCQALMSCTKTSWDIDTKKEDLQIKWPHRQIPPRTLQLIEQIGLGSNHWKSLKLINSLIGDNYFSSPVITKVSLTYCASKREIN